ncbi:hypothetical protein LCGC14_0470500 [marine sediment metagenome]|uniref:Ribbon-helix-helix protein CopG domain-containing protein n=1 Tax=marine sediment metagenome TaxID=412755 RepID=A0A0F9UZ58_9ZZZZ
MSTTENLDALIAVRVSKKSRKAFQRKADRYPGTSSDVLREIIEAFVDDRITITPDPKKESLYVS